MENLETMKNNLILKQSMLFGEMYSGLQKNELQTFNELSINDIDDWYNSLLIKYPLNNYQVVTLQMFFEVLKTLLATINPEKLNIKDTSVEDVDLLLWRESSFGISKLIFDEFGQIVYLFNGHDGRKIKGVFNQEVDMENLLYRFLLK